METYYLGNKAAEQLASPVISNRWQPLLLLNVFRILLSGAFCLLFLTGKLLTPFGSYNAQLFFEASLVYFVAGIALLILHVSRRFPFPVHVYTSVITDVLLITVIMHASGGVQSGIGVLLVVSIATGSIVMGGRSALGFAALATIVILLQQSYSSLTLPGLRNYPASGLLGITYFVTAIVFVFLARRISESEALAQKRGIDLANLSQLTEHIIQRMQTGVVVVDEYGVIRLINESAAQMLGLTTEHHTMHISALAPELAEQWKRWKENSDYIPTAIRLAHNPMDISPRCAQIGEKANSGTLIFLQDMSAMAQQAQQLQLAGLGRLTASIAHEIRNPLGAISHAGQLLAESENLDQNDLRMTHIIADHSQRLNTIVENIMSLSRRKPTQVELLNLKEYLERFITEYILTQGIDNNAIKLEITPDDTMVRFDSGYLQQILINLCDNGLRHSRESSATTKILLKGGLEEGANRPYLDISDAGPGVPPEHLNSLFEPFFTTETRGTGLGLYLSRELAEANQAHLNYNLTEDGNGYFRITFQDPRRQFD